MVAARGLSGVTLVFFLFSLADCLSPFPFIPDPHPDPPSERCSVECENGDLVAFTQQGGIDPFCDTNCSKVQCQRGCHLLQPALTDGCHQVCAVGTEQSRYCVRGCVLALDTHTTDVTEQFKSDIKAPSLFNRSSSTLTLSWDTPILPDVEYRVHKRLVTVDTRWQLHSDAIFVQKEGKNEGKKEGIKEGKKEGKIEISDLQSYTSYLFKVVMVMSSLPDSVRESPETGELTTLPQGAPATPPEFTTLTSPSPHTLYLSWAPPPFGHGQILTYRIYLQSVNQPGSDVLPSFEVPWNKTNWLVPSLQPGQEYNVSLTAVNSEGEGPRCERVVRTQLPSPASSGDPPFLVLGAGTKVIVTRLRHGSNWFGVSESFRQRQHAGVPTGARLSDGRTEYVDFKLGQEITDLDVHVRNQMVVVVQRSGAATLISLKDNSVRPNAYPSVKDAKTVSVDWLLDIVYLASTDQIFRCPLDGDQCVTVARDLGGPLVSLSVDPVNGFLFYVITGRGQGLYRISLDAGAPNQSSSGETPPGWTPLPELIVRMNDLVTQVVDFQNVQVYLLNSATRKVTAAALDGSGVRQVSSLTTQLNAVTRIALYNQSLIWTDGSTLYSHANSGSRQEEPLTGLGSPLSGFCVLHSSTQPTPVPSEAPIDVEVVFHTDKAIVQWKSPVLEYQGEGAYKNWTYLLQLSSSSSKGSNPSDTRNFTVVGLSLTITNLQPDTEYTIKIRATSAAGDGPWSVGFMGRTLADGNVKIVLAQDKGTLVERDLDGDSERLVFQADTNIQDMDWHEDLLLLLTENFLLVYNRTNQEQVTLSTTESAVSVAYDWLGLKIYWSELNQDMNKIQRSDISGTGIEFLCQILAYDIATDPVSGRLYWTTRYSIGSSYLNGEDVQEVLSLPLYSDTHIVSLTVDTVSKKVVWYVVGYNTQDIFMTDAPQLGDRFSSHVTPVRVGGCRSISSTSSLQHFTHHMLWLSKENSLLLGDTHCNNSAHLSQHSHVTSFVVTHPSLHSPLASVSGREVKVIPESLQPGNIGTQGVWSTFNLTWSPPADLIHGTVFYKLLIDRPGHVIVLTTVKNYVEMTETNPYVKMFVSIQPYTYWGYADVLTLTLRSPMAVPSAPLLSEVNIIHHKNLTARRQSLAADFRWEKPQNPNGIISHYLVTHWAGNGSQVTEKVKGTTQHFVLTPVSEQNTYYFKVSACTPIGCGPESQVKSASAAGVDQVPMLLYATSQAIYLAEVTKNYTARLVVPDVEARAVNFMGQNNPRVYWINTGNEVCESVDSFVHEVLVVNNTARHLSVDWVGRSLFIAESVGPELSQITEFNVDSRQYRTVVSRAARITSLAVNPYSSTLYWVEITSKGQGQLMTADLRSNKVRVLLGGKSSRGRRDTVSQLCSCSQDLNIAPVLALTYSEGGGEAEIILANADSGAIFASDVEGCLCSPIVGPTSSDSFGLPPSLLAVDRARVSWYNKTQARLYSLARRSAEPMVHTVQDVQDIVAYRPHQQPLPDPDCLDPGAMTSVPDLRSGGNTTLSLQLAHPVRPTSCLAISQPHFKFTVYYREVKDTKTGVTPDEYNSDSTTFDKQEFYSSQVELKNLEPFTRYEIRAAVSSFYVEYRTLTLSDPVFVTTSIGVPGVARNFTARPSNPEVIRVSWWPALKLNGPIEGTVYIIHLSVVINGTTIESEVEQAAKDVTIKGNFEVNVKNLRHNSVYTIKILTCGSNKTLCSATVPIECRTFEPPSDIQLLNATAHSLNITWKSPDHINRHVTIYAKVAPGELEWNNVNTLSMTEPSTEYVEEVTSLEPNTLYAIAIRVIYGTVVYRWPPDETRFSFRTLVSHPDQPAPPTINHLSSREYEVKWQEPRDNGAPILSYILQQSNTGGATWETAYNGSADHWLVDRSVLQHGKSYVYRVAALSSEGMSSFSDNSSVLLAPFALEVTQNNDVTMGVVVGIVVALAVVLVAAALVFHRRRRRNKIPQFVIHGPDKELATLRELPHTTFQQSNSLYAINILCTDEEIAKLPHFSRSQLLLTMFLGSGAFGEVFEGLARNIRGDRAGETRCAVKTLRKSATEQEKEEFLKEALLMKNFKHEHILGLLGVCLDNDPQFIIMELMEGGDLLSFLRSFRATVTSPAKLVLPDLVKICLHVARGCKYLEEMHFVHRDLAARNCLVSSKSPGDMVVKIGDFGLARDIYKNDYYRKEGEGLLPVRWMSPESLVDGFFTTQSDIWAFGVLMWEVVTLGQQPYPARTNIEVLHFVRDRGKLERPDKCAEEMYYLMSKCWSFLPNNRPSFASLVQKLEMFQDKCQQMTQEEIALYTPVFNSAQHDAMESLSEEEEEEEEEKSVRRGLFTPHSRPITGGGSVRLTQSAKQKRLTDLLGSTDTPEKLVVDLSKNNRKRTQSLEDSKLKSSQGLMELDSFPAANKYDHNGYLEPRGTKGGGRYLELMNYAPEVFHLRDPYGNLLVSGSSDTVLPVHLNHKGYHPTNASYTLLSPEEDTEDSHYQIKETDILDDESSEEEKRIYTPSPVRKPKGSISLQASPVNCYPWEKSQSSQSQGRKLTPCSAKKSVTPPATTRVRSPPHRKFSEQDLNSSPGSYPHSRFSPTDYRQGPRYSTVECNNNNNNNNNSRSASNGNVRVTESVNGGIISHRNGSSNGGIISHRNGSSNGLYAFAEQSGDCPLSVTLPPKSDIEVPRHGQDPWVSSTDYGITDDCSPKQGLSGDTATHQAHIHHGSRSRGQIFPESSTAVVGYDLNHVSLV